MIDIKEQIRELIAERAGQEIADEWNAIQFFDESGLWLDAHFPIPGGWINQEITSSPATLKEFYPHADDNLFLQSSNKEKTTMRKDLTAQDRKNLPIARGVLDYFPDALLEIAKVSKKGNEQHNPGQPLHWAKEKSTDEADALLRHLIDRGQFDTDGERHSAKVAWRALALLQRELDAEKGVLVKSATKGTYKPLDDYKVAKDQKAALCYRYPPRFK